MLRSSTAEDLAQETFVRAFVHFDRFDPERPLLPWLLAIARRLCLDLLRREMLMPTTAEIPATIDACGGAGLTHAPSPRKPVALTSTRSCGVASARTSTRVDVGKSPVKNSRRAFQTSSRCLMSVT